MRLSVKGLACAAGVLWGLAILLVGIANSCWPDYGKEFLDVVASVYPGYKAGPDIGQSVIGAVYGLVDGAIAGAVFAILYNLCAGRRKEA